MLEMFRSLMSLLRNGPCVRCRLMSASNARLERRVALCVAEHRAMSRDLESHVADAEQQRVAIADLRTQHAGLAEIARAAQELEMHDSVNDAAGAALAMGRLRGALDRGGYGRVNHA